MKNDLKLLSKQAEYWRGYCSNIGRTAPLYKAWGMIKKKMWGIRQDKNLSLKMSYLDLLLA